MPARRERCAGSTISPSSAGHWRACRRGSAACWCCATGRTCPWPRSPRCSAAQRRPWLARRRAAGSGPFRRAVRAGRARYRDTHKEPGMMMTDELENELRGAFTRAAASIAVPDEARSRLRQRDYRPRRAHRGLTAAFTAAAAVRAGCLVSPSPGWPPQPADTSPLPPPASSGQRGNGRRGPTTPAPVTAPTVCSLAASASPSRACPPQPPAPAHGQAAARIAPPARCTPWLL